MPGRVKWKKSEAFEHPRQPNESWWFVRRVRFRWIAGRFFQRARTVGMHAHAGAVERDGLDFDSGDLQTLHLGKNSVKNAAFDPAIHTRVNRVPIAKTLW